MVLKKRLIPDTGFCIRTKFALVNELFIRWARLNCNSTSHYIMRSASLRYIQRSLENGKEKIPHYGIFSCKSSSKGEGGKAARPLSFAKTMLVCCRPLNISLPSFFRSFNHAQFSRENSIMLHYYYATHKVKRVMWLWSFGSMQSDTFQVYWLI